MARAENSPVPKTTPVTPVDTPDPKEDDKAPTRAPEGYTLVRRTSSGGMVLRVNSRGR